MGQNGREIPNLEFENQGFLENQDFLPTEHCSKSAEDGNSNPS